MHPISSTKTQRVKNDVPIYSPPPLLLSKKKEKNVSQLYHYLAFIQKNNRKFHDETYNLITRSRRHQS